jgi:hypothetical protein
VARKCEGKSDKGLGRACDTGESETNTGRTYPAWGTDALSTTSSNHLERELNGSEMYSTADRRVRQRLGGGARGRGRSALLAKEGATETKRTVVATAAVKGDKRTGATPRVGEWESEW